MSVVDLAQGELREIDIEDVTTDHQVWLGGCWVDVVVPIGRDSGRVLYDVGQGATADIGKVVRRVVVRLKPPTLSDEIHSILTVWTASGSSSSDQSQVVADILAVGERHRSSFGDNTNDS